MSNFENDDWENLLDIDDSDLIYLGSQRTQPLTQSSQTLPVPTQTLPVPTESPTRSPTPPQRNRGKQPMSSSPTPPRPVTRGSGSDNRKELPYRIPGPAGILQSAYQIRDNEDRVLDNKCTQDFIHDVINAPVFDDSFTLAPWLQAMEFAYPYGGSSNIAEIWRDRDCYKVPQIVGVVKTCEPDFLGDLTVTLKDTTGTISGTIHHKITNGVEGQYEAIKGIGVGAVMVLQNTSVFACGKYDKKKALNITRRNLVKVFFKDGGSASCC